METATVTVSEKGQIAIPNRIRQSIGINRGDVLVLVQEGERIMIEKSLAAAKAIASGFAELKRELDRWDELSDEALKNFEAKL